MWEEVIESNGLTNAPNRIFNLDETGLAGNRVSSKLYAKKGVKDVYIQQPNCGKTMYTVLFCCSATGIYMPPFVVYKAKHLQRDWCMGGPEGSCYGVSESGYMHDLNFENWFQDAFIPFVSSYEKPVLLVMDGHGSHLTYKTIDLAMKAEIIIICIPPHTSHALQPLDVGVFKSVNTIWNEDILDPYHNEVRNQRPVDKEMFPSLLAKLWPRLKKENAKNGFRGCGLYPINKHAIDCHIISLREDSSTSTDDLPTPRKAMREAIISVISPSGEVQPKRGKRKRVQHECGEVLTEVTVLERLRQEEIERKAKKMPKSKNKKGVLKGVNKAKNKKPRAKKSLFCDFDTSNESNETDIMKNVSEKLKEKAKANRWSSGSSDFDLDELEIGPISPLSPEEPMEPVAGTSAASYAEPIAGTSAECAAGTSAEKIVSTPRKNKKKVIQPRD